MKFIDSVMDDINEFIDDVKYFDFLESLFLIETIVTIILWMLFIFHVVPISVPIIGNCIQFTLVIILIIRGELN